MVRIFQKFFRLGWELRSEAEEEIRDLSRLIGENPDFLGEQFSAIREDWLKTRNEANHEIKEIQDTIRRVGVVTTYEERTIPGGTRQVQTVAPTHVQVTSFVQNQNTHYRVGTIIASFNSQDYVIWSCGNPNDEAPAARAFQRFIIIPTVPAGTHTITLSYIGEMSGLQPQNVGQANGDEVEWSFVQNVQVTAKEIIGKTRV